MKNPNLGHKPRHKEAISSSSSGYYSDVRTEMVMTMQDIGLDVEAHHHEVATGGQQAIDLDLCSTCLQWSR